jgi:hypothetical protein
VLRLLCDGCVAEGPVCHVLVIKHFVTLLSMTACAAGLAHDNLCRLALTAILQQQP